MDDFLKNWNELKSRLTKTASVSPEFQSKFLDFEQSLEITNGHLEILLAKIDAGNSCTCKTCPECKAALNRLRNFREYAADMAFILALRQMTSIL